MIARLLLLAVLAGCAAKPPSPTVGGLRLGMPASEAVGQAEALFSRLDGAQYRQPQWRQWDSFSVHTDRPFEDDLTIRTGDGGVRYLCFNRGLVNRLYDSASASPEQLAARFSAAHGLPPMALRTDDNPPKPVHYWEYVSPQGWKVVIDQDKNLVLDTWRRASDNEK